MLPIHCTTAWAKILPVLTRMKLTIKNRPHCLRHLPISKGRMGEEVLAAGGGVWIDAGRVQRPSGHANPDADGSGKRNPDGHRHLVPSHRHCDATAAQPATSTADTRPGVGRSVIFPTPSTTRRFGNTAGSDDASAILTNSRLVLSITQPGPLAIASLRNQSIAGDFYAEAHGKYQPVQRHRPVRDALSAPQAAGIIFASCSTATGRKRLERVRGGVTYPLLGWLPAMTHPWEAPAQIKLGVWAVGREMRLFLNETYQFSLTDPVFSAGTSGFSPMRMARAPLRSPSLTFRSIPSPIFSPRPSPVPS